MVHSICLAYTRSHWSSSCCIEQWYILHLFSAHAPEGSVQCASSVPVPLGARACPCEHPYILAKCQPVSSCRRVLCAAHAEQGGPNHHCVHACISAYFHFCIFIAETSASRSQLSDELERARGALATHRAAIGSLEEEGTATRQQAEVGASKQAVVDMQQPSCVWSKWYCHL